LLARAALFFLLLAGIAAAHCTIFVKRGQFRSLLSPIPSIRRGERAELPFFQILDNDATPLLAIELESNATFFAAIRRCLMRVLAAMSTFAFLACPLFAQDSTSLGSEASTHIRIDGIRILPLPGKPFSGTDSECPWSGTRLPRGTALSTER
jgi:hypothetical protein